MYKMNQYTDKQIQDTLKIVESSIVNCENVRLKLKAQLRILLILIEFRRYIFQKHY